MFWVRRSDFLRPSDFGPIFACKSSTTEIPSSTENEFPQALGPWPGGGLHFVYLFDRVPPMKIAQIAPLYESVPPKYYGGTERVVSYLTEELVR